MDLQGEEDWEVKMWNEDGMKMDAEGFRDFAALG